MFSVKLQILKNNKVVENCKLSKLSYKEHQTKETSNRKNFSFVKIDLFAFFAGLFAVYSFNSYVFLYIDFNFDYI